VFTNWNPSSIVSGIFNLTWDGCTSLTAQSVENILTSIDSTGHHATTNKLAGGTPLADAGIDIDYNGDPLSAATTAAIDSLSGKGWQVYINGELVIPNILDLEPAAAYSLRSFDADADPNVVKVRRSSDGALSDFTASEVSDGTLTSWVNTDVDLVTPTLNNGGFEDGSTGWTLSNAAIDTSEFYAGSKSVKLTVTGGAGAFVYKANLQVNSSYRVGFWAKISDASKQMRVEFGSAANKEDINFTSTNWEYKEVTKSATAVGLSFARQSTSGDYTINIDNITVTQLTADGHVTTWYDQSDNGNDSTQSTASAQPKIVDGGTLVTEGGLAAINFHTEVSNLSLDHSDLYGQATLDSYYVTSTSDTTYLYPSLIGYGNTYGWVAEQGSSTGGNGAGYGSGVLYVNGLLVNPSTRNDVYNVLSGHNLAVHKGASTSNTDWETYQMNFGNYLNNTVYGYTGKLQEMIFFNTDQSANRTGIENNINDHFDIYS